jgi:membrane fusion protein (multidrug efflux system)
MSGLRAQSACIALMLAAMAPLLAGCEEPTAATAAAQPNEPDVSVVTVTPQARAVVRELPGRIAPTRVSEVRPRVSGIVVERLFSQGSEVKAGDPLYKIDPRPFEVEVQSNEAALARVPRRVRISGHLRATSRTHSPSPD